MLVEQERVAVRVGDLEVRGPLGRLVRLGRDREPVSIFGARGALDSASGCIAAGAGSLTPSFQWRGTAPVYSLRPMVLGQCERRINASAGHALLAHF